MPLYQIDDKKASFLKPTDFANERELQRLIEANLPVVLDAQFVATEFPIIVDGLQGGRIDTLALDKEYSPVIIEYKKGTNSSVINQGLFYLDWLFTHKGDFEIAVQKKLGMNITVNWENPRLIAIAERFSVYDVYGVRRMGANIELWTYRYFNGNMLLLEAVYTPDGGGKSGKAVLKPDGFGTGAATDPIIPPVAVLDEKPTYDLAYHTRGKSAHVKELFDALRERILELQSVEGGIVEVFRKKYVGYKHGKNFCEVHLYQFEIVIWLDIAYEDLSDPLNLAIDASQKGHWGTGDVELRLSKMEDIDAVLDLIAQAYEYTS